MPPVWYPRMGDIPGLDYEPPVAVDRRTLRAHDARPEVHRFEMEGRIRESLMWSHPDMEYRGSASPARALAFNGETDRATSTMLRDLWNSLELPGIPSDYHFAIAGVAGSLYPRRVEEPENLGWVEYLYWLDIKLIQACPEAVSDDHRRPDGKRFYSIPAFDGLISLYTREGYLQEALNVARISQRFEQGEHLLGSIEARLEMLQVEDGG